MYVGDVYKCVKENSKFIRSYFELKRNVKS